MNVRLAATIHGEADLIRYVAEFSAEVYEIMTVYVMKIYDMNMKLYMQECMIENVQRMHMSILW